MENILIFDNVITDMGFEGEVTFFYQIAGRWFARIDDGKTFVCATLNSLRKVRRLEVKHEI